MSKYDTIPRGKCPLCIDYVWSDQGRNKDNKGVYRHIRCPRRQSGTMKELERRERILGKRTKKYEEMTLSNREFGKNKRDRNLLTGLKLYLQLPIPRPPVAEYDNEESEGFTWKLSKLYNALSNDRESKRPKLEEIIATVGNC